MLLFIYYEYVYLYLLLKKMLFIVRKNCRYIFFIFVIVLFDSFFFYVSKVGYFWGVGDVY